MWKCIIHEEFSFTIIPELSFFLAFVCWASGNNFSCWEYNALSCVCVLISSSRESWLFNTNYLEITMALDCKRSYVQHYLVINSSLQQQWRELTYDALTAAVEKSWIFPRKISKSMPIISIEWKYLKIIKLSIAKLSIRWKSLPLNSIPSLMLKEQSLRSSARGRRQRETFFIPNNLL